ASDIDTSLAPRIRNVRSVRHQPAGFGIVTDRIYRGDAMARRQVDQLNPTAIEEGVATEKKRFGPLVYKSCESRIDLAAGAGVENPDLQPHRAGSRLNVFQRGLGIGAGRIDEHGNTSGGGH